MGARVMRVGDVISVAKRVAGKTCAVADARGGVKSSDVIAKTVS